MCRTVFLWDRYVWLVVDLSHKTLACLFSERSALQRVSHLTYCICSEPVQRKHPLDKNTVAKSNRLLKCRRRRWLWQCLSSCQSLWVIFCVIYKSWAQHVQYLSTVKSHTLYKLFVSSIGTYLDMLVPVRRLLVPTPTGCWLPRLVSVQPIKIFSIPPDSLKWSPCSAGNSFLNFIDEENGVIWFCRCLCCPFYVTLSLII